MQKSLLIFSSRIICRIRLRVLTNWGFLKLSDKPEICSFLKNLEYKSYRIKRPNAKKVRQFHVRRCIFCTSRALPTGNDMLDQTRTLRRLDSAEFPDSLDLLQYSFQFKVTDSDRIRLARNFAGERLWGIFDSTNLQSQLCTLPFQINLNAQPVQAAGITRVSSYPEARRKGNISRLVRHALQQLHDERVPLALLIPFDVGFYRRFGWELVNDYIRLSFHPSSLPKRHKTPGIVSRGEPAAEIAASLFGEYALNFNGAILRTPYWWSEVTRPLKSGFSAVSYDADGKPTGYVIYTLDDRRQNLDYQQLRGERTLIIKELIYTDHDARRKLWDFLLTHETMIDRVVLTTPVDDILPFELSGGAYEETRVPYAMGRIVDLQSYIAAYRFNAAPKASEFHLDIADHLADWNNGSWCIRIDENGAASAERVSTLPPSAFKTDIGALTALFFGYVRPSALAGSGRLSADTATLSALDALLPHTTPYLPDFF